jgi:hypothetical protein
MTTSRSRGWVRGTGIIAVVVMSSTLALGDGGDRGGEILNRSGRISDAPAENFFDRSPPDVEAGLYDTGCGPTECGDPDPRVPPQADEDSGER